MSHSCHRAVALLVCLTIPCAASAAITIDFEDLVLHGYLEGDHVSSLFVTDPQTGYSTTVTFSIFNGLGPSGTPILVQEGEAIPGISHAFAPLDTPAGETLGNGNDWFLGNGMGVPDNYRMQFSSPVQMLSLDLYDFRSDGPFSGGTPGSDYVELNTFDLGGTMDLLDVALSSYTVPDPRPEDGQIVTLMAPHSNIYRADLVFYPPGVDAGTAIDNITFTIVPEPAGASLVLTSLGLLGLVCCRKR